MVWIKNLVSILAGTESCVTSQLLKISLDSYENLSALDVLNKGCFY